jgi:hypothetical protein
MIMAAQDRKTVRRDVATIGAQSTFLEVAIIMPKHKLMNCLYGRDSRVASVIVAVLLLKAAMLLGLWHACFSVPQAVHMSMPVAQVVRHILVDRDCRGMRCEN